LESKWGDIISSIRNQLIVCSSCGKETFVDMDKPSNCIECGKPVKVSYRIQSNNHGSIALSPKKNIFLGKSYQPIAVVQIKQTDPSVWELKNLSPTTWSVETTIGTIRTIATNEFMPVKPGLKITFSQGEKGEIS
jgi:ribosomal protein L37E